MKFLCDNCKAKYQIADEKVAGKTVRMKCRKCGHQIEVRAAITETSVSGAPPAPDRSAAPRGALATSLSAAKPRPASSPGPGGGALAGAFQRNVQDAPATVPFPNAAQAASIDASIEMSVTDEWYVAINGVPVGPVRISELRRKAATGAVTEDSLCWQEGLEEWRPVRSLPELAAIVREAAQGNRPSLLAPPPPQAPTPEPPRAQPHAQSHAPRPPPARPGPMAPRTPEPLRTSEPPRPAPLAPSRNNVVPLHAPRVAASAMDDMPPQTAPLGGAAAALAPMAMAPAPVIAVADPFALPPAPLAPNLAAPNLAPSMGSGVSVVPAAAPAALASTSLAPPPPAKRGVPLWFWPVLVFVAVFAGVAGIYIFKGGPAQVVIKEVQVATPATATAKTDDIPPPSSAEPTTSASAPSTAATGKVATNTGPKVTGTAPTTSSTSKTADLSGLLGGAGGPSAGPGGGASGPAGGTMDAATVQRIVRERSPGVKRACWDRGGDQKTSAKVTVAITVGGNGHVDNATATGDDPVITKCIENQVRNWQFPATGSSTTVNVPFVFVRQ